MNDERVEEKASKGVSENCLFWGKRFDWRSTVNIWNFGGGKGKKGSEEEN